MLYAAKSVINCTICREIPSLTYFLFINVTYNALYVTFLSNIFNLIEINPSNAGKFCSFLPFKRLQYVDSCYKYNQNLLQT